MAALSPDHQVIPLVVAGIAGNFQNGYIGTWTTGVEQQLHGVTVNASYVGTAGDKLPSTDYLNGFVGADSGFAPYTQFDSAGRAIGGYGMATVLTNGAHSSYHSLQVSAQNTLSSFGLGFQASYSFSKSIDDVSSVIGAGSAPQNPFDTNAEKGPSGFDIGQAANFSLFQDLHADRAPVLRLLGRKLTAGWQLLGIGSFMTGLPFTVNSGIQQTGVGAIGSDRPDQVGIPDLSTSRTVREDYFGRGADNPSFFHIPTNVPGGTGPNQGRFGTLGRNTFRGPSFENLDIAVIKNTPLMTRSGSERAALQFRAELFNIFNLVNFGLPATVVLGPGFGEINHTASNSRQIQFSLKVIY
jgi:hypothetical protein